MKNNLNEEERKILESFEKGEWKSVPNLVKRKVDLRSYARATLLKDKRVNIRISERDLRELQRQAVHEGLPYQTFISSILHKFINGSLT
ncbi:MAG: antitoxin [Thermodesulfobacteriota bacterium]|nr:antitoxin [Thermodesulfobacteriota bacterium]